MSLLFEPTTGRLPRSKVFKHASKKDAARPPGFQEAICRRELLSSNGGAADRGQRARRAKDLRHRFDRVGVIQQTVDTAAVQAVAAAEGVGVAVAREKPVVAGEAEEQVG